jgi:predicted peroxiredoxin
LALRVALIQRTHQEATMKRYLLIESRGFEAADTANHTALAAALVREGAKVEIMLVQNGVIPARKGARAESLIAAIQAGIPVWADEFAMKERALAPKDLVAGVKQAAIGTVVDRMADGWNVIWH